VNQDAGQNRDRKEFDASCLVLGFTGSLGSGCTFLAEGVKKKLGDAGRYHRLSQFLEQEADSRHVEKTVENLQTLGDELRLKHGNWILAKMCLDKIKEDDQQSGFSQNEETVLLIDGIKNGGEVKYLRQFPNFYLIWA
jgi:dephospho-CoA kinase